MEHIATTIAFFTIGLSYPAISGPIAAYLLVLTLKRDNRRLLLAFWSALLLIHVAGFLLVIANPGALFTEGFVACLATPVFAAATALGLRIAWRRLSSDEWKDSNRRRWLLAGNVLLPLMQVATVFAAILVAPYL